MYLFDQNYEGYCHHCKKPVSPGEIVTLPSELENRASFRVCEYCMGEIEVHFKGQHFIDYWKNWLALMHDRTDIFEKLSFHTLEVTQTEEGWKVMVAITNHSDSLIHSLYFRGVFYNNKGEGLGGVSGEIKHLKPGEKIITFMETIYNLTGFVDVSYQCEEIKMIEKGKR